MRIYPAIHYTMGGLWVDYNLMSTIPGLHVLGEANFSDHGANRLGASALMQGLADGYFVIPYTLANYLGGTALPPVTTEHDAFNEAEAVRSRDHRPAAFSQGLQNAAPAAPRAWRCSLGRRGDGEKRGRPAQGTRAHPTAARGVLAQRLGSGPTQHAQQEPRVRGTGGRLPRVCGTADDGRAASHGVVRRALPRRKPDARRRGTTRRRAFCVRGSMGVSGRRRPRGSAQGTTDLRVREADSDGATNKLSALSCQLSAVSSQLPGAGTEAGS